MIFMFIENSFEGHVPDLNLDQIGKIIETKDEGTYPDSVLNLNGAREVVSAVPSIEFVPEIKPHTLDELLKEVQDKQPPIAWVALYDKEHIHKCRHAIVITDVDRENNRICYNDPIFGERSEDISSFLVRWDEGDRILIKVKIGKSLQRRLEEFDKKNEKQEKLEA
jgi:hypothetical protein